MPRRIPETKPEEVQRGIAQITEQTRNLIPSGEMPRGYRPPTPEVLPHPGPSRPQNWGQLTDTERWLYEKLPAVAENEWVQRLENFANGPAGTILKAFDIGAEALERVTGLAVQMAAAVGDPIETEDLRRNFAAAWTASSLAADFAMVPVKGEWAAMPGVAGLVAARKRIAAGESLVDVQASMYEDLGALALRASLQDATFHILGDPINILLPVIKPVSRLQAWRLGKVYNTGDDVADAVRAMNGAYDALSTAQAAGKPLDQSGDLLRAAQN